MIQVGLLFSGGKDSALAAILLEPVEAVTLVTGTFGITEDWRVAKAAADSLGLPFERLELDRSVAESAAEQILADGYPRVGIQLVHEHALERAAEAEFDAIADGTRRDDRTPTVDRSLARSLEDRHGVEYIAPLRGLGRRTVDRLVGEHLEVVTGPSESIERADYEGELRALLGPEATDSLFPAHEQSRVVGRADS